MRKFARVAGLLVLLVAPSASADTILYQATFVETEPSAYTYVANIVLDSSLLLPNALVPASSFASFDFLFFGNSVTRSDLTAGLILDASGEPRCFGYVQHGGICGGGVDLFYADNLVLVVSGDARNWSAYDATDPDPNSSALARGTYSFASVPEPTTGLLLGLGLLGVAVRRRHIG